MQYHFYIEGDFAKTVGVTFSAPLRIVYIEGLVQVWHKPARTVRLDQLHIGNDPAFYKLVKVELLPPGQPFDPSTLLATELMQIPAGPAWRWRQQFHLAKYHANIEAEKIRKGLK